MGRDGAGESAARMGQHQDAADREARRRQARLVLPAAAVGALVLWAVLGAPGLILGGILVAAVALQFFAPGNGSSWTKGAAGERRTARLMEPLERDGWTVLHDRAIPGSKANLDHVLISPYGEVVYVDTKAWASNRSRLRVKNDVLWYGRYPQTRALDTVAWEASEAAKVLQVDVTPYVAVIGTEVPNGKVHLQGVTVVPVKTLIRHLRKRTPAPTTEVNPRQLAEQAEELLPPHSATA